MEGVPLEQPVKDPVLSLQWIRVLLWRGFKAWRRNLHMPWVWQKKKKEIKYVRCVAECPLLNMH